jgi:hypothetical protein
MNSESLSFESKERNGYFKNLFTKPIDLHEYQNLVIQNLELLQESFLWLKKGQAAKITTQLSAKLLTTSATSWILLSTAALFGTASTGTAISSLSGVAFTNAALAWWGGSVAAGAAIVGSASATVGLAMTVIVGYGWRRFISGSGRKEKTLTEIEARIKIGIEQALLALSKQQFDDLSFLMLWRKMIIPIIDELEKLLKTEYKKWPFNNKRKLEKALKNLKKLRKKTNRKLSGSVTFGVSQVGAFFYKVYSDSTKWSDEDKLVLKAFARSTNDLNENSTFEEISAYLRSYTDEDSRNGLLANIKGIYHELAFENKENTDGDNWLVQLEESTTSAGVDAYLVNSKMDERIPIQLKASDNYSTTKSHYDQYPEIGVFGTSEIADVSNQVSPSGFANRELTDQVFSTAEKLESKGTLTVFFQDTATLASASAFIAMTITFGEAMRNGHSLDTSTKSALNAGRKAIGFAAISALVGELNLI